MHRRLKPACCKLNPSHRSLPYPAWISVWLLVPHSQPYIAYCSSIQLQPVSYQRPSKITHDVPIRPSNFRFSTVTVSASGQPAFHPGSHYHGYSTKQRAEASKDESFLRFLFPRQSTHGHLCCKRGVILIRHQVKCDKVRPTCHRCGNMGICCNYSPSMRYVLHVQCSNS
jgi:hypothetical protein